MLVRLADFLNRQDAEIEIAGCRGTQRVEMATVDGAVGAKRKMRAMLFGRGDRQDRDRPGRVDVTKVRRGIIAPDETPALPVMASSRCNRLDLDKEFRPDEAGYNHQR